jgi:DNA-binding transcriptional regulator YhcF (GntR family)
MIRIDLHSSTSLEEQLRSQIRELIVTGELAHGQALPSSRQLAADLAIHFNTVARAYRRLQDDGLLAIEHGRGVFVKRDAARVSHSGGDVRSELSGRLRQVFVDARLLGLSAAQMHELVTRELHSFFPAGTVP